MDRLSNLDFIIRCLMADEGVSYQIPSSLADKQRMMRALMNVRPPTSATEAFLNAQDAELRQQRADKGVVTVADMKAANESPCTRRTPLLLWQGDITRLQVDAIVNAANSQLLGCWSPLHACIDNCIHSAAGIQLRGACHELMQAQGHDEDTGQAKITLGYNLPAKYVIHTVGPIIPNGRPTLAQEAQLASCYRSCLDVAERTGCESIAFCCISTGVFRFPNERAAEIAVDTVSRYPLKSLKTIVFNVFLDKDYAIYQQLLSPSV